MPDNPAFHLLFTPAGAYAAFWLAFSVIVFFNSLINLLYFKKPKASLIPNDQLPFISVLVPARNEEQTIEACIRSLLTQNYPNFEVIALDDNSGDDTYDILCRLRDQDYRLRVLVGAALPAGWCGKPHACWQMSKAAVGEYILLTDADCVFAPDALLFAVGAQRQDNTDVISFMPDYIAKSFWEKLLIPLLMVIPLAFLPFGLVRGTRFPIFSAANGAFLFLSRENYFVVGGHREVKAELTEDIKFSQLVKRRGKSLAYLDGKNVYKVRMYKSMKEIWVGCTRILLPAFDNLWACFFGMFIALNLFILPIVLAFSGYLYHQPWAFLCALTYLVCVAQRALLAVTLDRDSILMVPFSPVSWTITFAIACGSIYRCYSGKAEWKGRVYKGGSAK
jgi:chlorobactene glucosyltransferase